MCWVVVDTFFLVFFGGGAEAGTTEIGATVPGDIDGRLPGRLTTPAGTIWIECWRWTERDGWTIGGWNGSEGGAIGSGTDG